MGQMSKEAQVLEKLEKGLWYLTRRLLEAPAICLGDYNTALHCSLKLCLWLEYTLGLEPVVWDLACLVCTHSSAVQVAVSGC